MTELAEPAQPRRLGRLIGLVVGISLLLLAVTAVGLLVLMPDAFGASSAAGGCGGG